jgi:hypothetical protein
MNLYLYNIVNGEPTNIPSVGTNKLLVSVYSGSSYNTAALGPKLKLPRGGGVAAVGDTNITASWVETGVYSASFAYTSASITTIFDIWHSGGVGFHTGTGVQVKRFDSKDFNFDKQYVSKITNLRPTYSTLESGRFRLYVRPKNWRPNIYTVSSINIPNRIIDNAYFRLVRASDNFEIIPFGTGTLNYTRLSYDASGSYFDLNLEMLEGDTVYTIKFMYLINGTYVEQPEEFKFRVE